MVNKNFHNYLLLQRLFLIPKLVVLPHNQLVHNLPQPLVHNNLKKEVHLEGEVVVALVVVQPRVGTETEVGKNAKTKNKKIINV
jgi:hypothetical protein